jgi:hypothetical protein
MTPAATAHQPVADESDRAERPPISTAVRLRSESSVDDERERLARQPGLGLRGLGLVIPIAVLLSIGAGSPEASVVVLAPLVTFALPVVAMVAFWWEDWPGTRLRATWSGWGDTVLIAVAAIVLTGIGQAIAGHLDLRGIFDPTPGPGHVPTFPATLALAGAAFVAMLEVTLVSEGWPLRRIPPLPAGVVALAISWAIALVLYFTLVAVHPAAGSGLVDRSGPVAGKDLGAVLVVVGAWQVWLFVAWRGWPFSEIDRRWLRLSAANLLVIGGAVLTYVVAHDVGGVRSARLSAVAGSFVAAGVVLGMLLDGWPRTQLSPAHERLITLAGIVLLGTVLAVLLTVYADGRHFRRASPDEWVAHVGLNAIGVSVILHVAVGRRWPFAGAGVP